VQPSSKYQVYVSQSNDPYLNLSIEHHLLQKTPDDSTVLFLYGNRPSVVIGRNQNPWTEVNLAMLKPPSTTKEALTKGNVAPEEVLLVRRRSGGGAVFHDEGNVNYSVIGPTLGFSRDKHAAMVVRALRSLGIDRARVNERHDIVLDRGYSQMNVDPNDERQTPFTNDGSSQKPLKVSGSAYKLTRLRSLHHGTCLLSSPNLHALSQYLQSPAKPFIKARGVESVSSPVGNIGIANEDFRMAVIKEFGAMYGLEDDPSVRVSEGFDKDNEGGWVFGMVGVHENNVLEIRKGAEELRVSSYHGFCWDVDSLFIVLELDIWPNPTIRVLEPLDE
jgi:lipoate-protein ligase A